MTLSRTKSQVVRPNTLNISRNYGCSNTVSVTSLSPTVLSSPKTEIGTQKKSITSKEIASRKISMCLNRSQDSVPRKSSWSPGDVKSSRSPIDSNPSCTLKSPLSKAKNFPLRKSSVVSAKSPIASAKTPIADLNNVSKCGPGSLKRTVSLKSSTECKTLTLFSVSSSPTNVCNNINSKSSNVSSRSPTRSPKKSIGKEISTAKSPVASGEKIVRKEISAVKSPIASGEKIVRKEISAAKSPIAPGENSKYVPRIPLSYAGAVNGKKTIVRKDAECSSPVFARIPSLSQGSVEFNSNRKVSVSKSKKLSTRSEPENKEYSTKPVTRKKSLHRTTAVSSSSTDNQHASKCKSTNNISGKVVHSKIINEVDCPCKDSRLSSQDIVHIKSRTACDIKNSFTSVNQDESTKNMSLNSKKSGKSHFNDPADVPKYYHMNNYFTDLVASHVKSIFSPDLIEKSCGKTIQDCTLHCDEQNIVQNNIEHPDQCSLMIDNSLLIKGKCGILKDVLQCSGGKRARHCLEEDKDITANTSITFTSTNNYLPVTPVCSDVISKDCCTCRSMNESTHNYANDSYSLCYNNNPCFLSDKSLISPKLRVTHDELYKQVARLLPATTIPIYSNDNGINKHFSPNIIDRKNISTKQYKSNAAAQFNSSYDALLRLVNTHLPTNLESSFDQIIQLYVLDYLDGSKCYNELPFELDKNAANAASRDVVTRNAKNITRKKVSACNSVSGKRDGNNDGTPGCAPCDDNTSRNVSSADHSVICLSPKLSSSDHNVISLSPKLSPFDDNLICMSSKLSSSNNVICMSPKLSSFDHNVICMSPKLRSSNAASKLSKSSVNLVERTPHCSINPCDEVLWKSMRSSECGTDIGRSCTNRALRQHYLSTSKLYPHGSDLCLQCFAEGISEIFSRDSVWNQSLFPSTNAGNFLLNGDNYLCTRASEYFVRNIINLSTSNELEKSNPCCNVSFRSKTKEILDDLQYSKRNIFYQSILPIYFMKFIHFKLNLPKNFFDKCGINFRLNVCFNSPWKSIGKPTQLCMLNRKETYLLNDVLKRYSIPGQQADNQFDIATIESRGSKTKRLIANEQNSQIVIKQDSLAYRLDDKKKEVPKYISKNGLLKRSPLKPDLKSKCNLPECKLGPPRQKLNLIPEKKGGKMFIRTAQVPNPRELHFSKRFKAAIIYACIYYVFIIIIYISEHMLV